MSELKSHLPPQLPDDETIVPVDFTPLEAQRKSFTLNLSPARLVMGAALLMAVTTGWFVLTAKSVFFAIDPVIEHTITLDGPLAIKIGPRYLMRPGQVAVNINAEGYYQFSGAFEVGADQAQTFAVELMPLPGFLDLDTGSVTGAEVSVDGEAVGTTPLQQLELAAGEHTIGLRKARYENLQTTLSVEGRSQTQSLSLELLPDWGNVAFSSTPAGATISIDGVDIGQTPMNAEVLSGEHEVVIKLPAHKAWTDSLTIAAREDRTLPDIALEPADGLVLLRSSPSNDQNLVCHERWRGDV